MLIVTETAKTSTEESAVMDDYSNNYIKYLDKVKSMGVVEFNKLTLDKISQSKINSFVCVNPDTIAQAQKIQNELSNGKSLSLCGLPVGIKDNIDVKGIATTCGSRVLDTPAQDDAVCVKRIMQAGGIIVGKTNMDEFAMGSGNVTSAFGPVLNPNDNTLVPGGSSGGSAAAVAAGLVPFALGSDTGGSIRQPAACCGIVGFKPSVGDVDRKGLVVTVPELDSIGVLACDSTACKALYEVISDKILDEACIDDIKVAYVDTDFVDCDQKVTDDFAIVLKLFKDNFSTHRASIPYLEDAVDIYGEMSCTCNAAALKEIYLKHQDLLSSETKRRVANGLAQSNDDNYKKALEQKKLLTESMNKVFENADVIISPTSPLLPFALDATPRINPDLYTQPASLANLPAISLPISKRGTALQIIAKRDNEALIFALSKWFEQNFTIMDC